MDRMTRRDALTVAGLSLPLAATGALGAPQAPPQKKYLILSCDGGGIRGLLTARIIQRLQNEVPFLDKVELFAGTSTGGIIALGLANQVSPADLVKLYRRRGPEIFPKEAATIKPPVDEKPKPPDEANDKPAAGGIFGQLFNELSDNAQALVNRLPFHTRDLLHPMYPDDGIKTVLSDFFGEATLGQVKSGKSVLVTTLRLFSKAKNWAPLVLHNMGPDEAATDTRVQDRPARSTRLVDAALCTSAAPLYFPPHWHPEFGYCVDGGLFANCPASIAFGLACRASQGNVNNIRILSIGTGSQISGIDIPRSIPFIKPTDYGALAWLAPIHRGEILPGDTKERLTPAFPLVSALFDASSASHNYICMQALDTNYCRVQVDLPKPIALDDASDEALSFLEKADQLISPQDWKSTTDWLKGVLKS